MQWPEDLGPIASSVYFSTPEWVERHSAEAVGLTRAMGRALRWLQDRGLDESSPSLSRRSRARFRPEGLGLTGYFEAQKLRAEPPRSSTPASTAGQTRSGVEACLPVRSPATRSSTRASPKKPSRASGSVAATTPRC